MDRPRTLYDLEIQALVIAFGWAVWLLIGQPFASLTVFHVAQFASEWVWALALLVGVASHLYGWLRVHDTARRGGLVWLGVIWLVMAGCILVANPRAPGIWTLWALAVSAFYVAAKL